jgi:hypothetical protein
VKNKLFVLQAGFIIFSSFILISSCSKINDATTLGGDLIPVVDNISTFDTTLEVQTLNGIFSILEDSARSSVSLINYVGEITNDPIFGKSNATIFAGFSPNFPFRFKASKDNVSIDSVVLVLNYRYTYGDTTLPHTVNVYEIDPFSEFRSDTSYLIRERPFATQGSLVGSRTGVLPSELNDSVFVFNEAAANQLRVKLDNAFGTRLLQLDTLKYNTDSAFRTAFKGFEITATGGNSLLGISLTDTNTKLAVYYHYNKNGSDTSVVDYFRPNSQTAAANHVQRDYAGSQLENYQGGTTPDDLVFLQNTPGTFAHIEIPGLAQLNNRVIHRAELIIEQIFDPSDIIFTRPAAIYLDAFDGTNDRFKTIPYDVMYDGQSGQINGAVIGFNGKSEFDNSGNPIQVWRLNISRYVQHVVNDVDSVYKLRLSTPYLLYNYTNIMGVEREVPLLINQTYAIGRIRVGGGNHPTQKMRLRIVYSKI